MLFTIELPTGRRRQRVAEAQVLQDIVVQQELSKTILAQQLAALSSDDAVDSLSDTRPKTQTSGGIQRPFTSGNAVGYQPIITTLPEGTNLQAMAVISANQKVCPNHLNAIILRNWTGHYFKFSCRWTGGAVEAVVAEGGGGQQGGGQQGWWSTRWWSTRVVVNKVVVNKAVVNKGRWSTNVLGCSRGLWN